MSGRATAVETKAAGPAAAHPCCEWYAACRICCIPLTTVRTGRGPGTPDRAVKGMAFDCHSCLDTYIYGSDIFVSKLRPVVLELW